MTDKNTLDQARSFAKAVAANPNGYDTKVHAAAVVIHLLPDEWVAAEELREVVADHHSDMSEELMEALGALLPDPPAPPTMAEIEWDYAEHRLAEATVSELSGRLHEKVLMLEIDDFGNIRSLDPTTREMWSLSPGRLTPTGRRYRLEPEDATPASSIEDKPAPESSSSRPDGCCGACPETVGGGVDCTCADNPRCPKTASPRPEDVPVGEPWQVEFDGETAIGFRNDPEDLWPWCVTYQVHSRSDWLGDEDVTLIARLVPETTDQDEEPDFAPAYTYRDKDGDVWEYIDGGWFTGDTRAKRVAKREHHCGRPSLPAEYGPYTRIEKENQHDQ